MDVATLKRKIAAGEGMALLDVRDADEIRQDPFFVLPPQNYLNIPMLPLLFSTREELEEKIFTSLGLPVSTLIVTLCHSGGRSARACAQLRNFGWKAENLAGGKEAWGDAI